jgi:hypothetical protein
MARPNPLADPEFAKQVAECFVDGLSRQEMCDVFGVKDPDTITRWRRDARVKAHAFKLIEDRVLQITRKTDAIIVGRLSNPDTLTTKEVLEIRKEFLGGKLREQHEKADDDTIHDAMDWLSNNPEEAQKLQDILDGKEEHPVVTARE